MVSLFDETNNGYWFVDREIPEFGIAVLSEFRKQGVGRILMKEIIKQAKFDGYESLSLSVAPENQVAVGLYSIVGYQESHRP
jgi:ribosomal protein S18 acetylase RimI-like enzyme